MFDFLYKTIGVFCARMRAILLVHAKTALPETRSSKSTRPRVGLEAGLTKPKMQRIAEEVCEAVKQWIHFAEQSDIPESKAREDFVNFHFVF